ncbi:MULTISPECIES: type VI secretion system protein TssA [Pseudomonas]|uniref:ImpA N-terminal domain-containing protein n=2 Tax=Pseudomonas viridiflava TaxID=33069 RepID=A0A1Y6JNE1_PSEVI|nr:MULTISPECIES: type VI secretion system protein TssA [Pseudomonas]MBV1809727.1 type VI secretion system protein TssA [Pseudomonas viridiflava]MBV1812308.1 type VI secretion system protein TssA [Pseudomonas viridiflava]MCI3909418.1 type VI secretion system protein TssA [Pseudomonas viridiflava]MEE4129953.1 type VI secretion system protein TssA [Pseudomonas viridiflava]MEE4159417.1 type VI secretion system protein TssA [Pseudomonas viridiflava]
MTHFDTLSGRYLHLIKSPVSSHGYAGSDVRFSEEFEALEARLSSEQSVLGTGNVDWLKVREESERILRDQSRDLRVACWLTWALYKAEAFPGLLAGTCMLRYLCEHHWPVLHPVKHRTRIAAFSWLVTRLDRVLVDDVSIKQQLSLFQRLSDHLEGLDELLRHHLGEEAPLILPTRRRLARMLQAASQKESKPTIAEQVKEVATQFFSHPSVENDKDARKALGTQQDITQSLCAWWLRQKATDVRALRLNRTVLWLTVDTAPKCNAERITALRSVPVDRLNNYRERFEQGKYADLIVDLELSIARSPFWFDGQRRVWECLQALNAELSMREVEVQCALFLHRVPGIAELRFHDGVPFADDETQGWISTHVMHHVLPPQPEPAQTNTGVQPAWNVVMGEIIQRLHKDGLKAAVKELTWHLTNAKSERERFFWQFNIARVCHRAKKYELARVQLELLDQELEMKGLGSWEAEAFLEISRLLYSCHEKLPPDRISRVSKDEVYRRLCKYDFEAVLNKT